MLTNVDSARKDFVGTLSLIDEVYTALETIDISTKSASEAIETLLDRFVKLKAPLLKLVNTPNRYNQYRDLGKEFCDYWEQELYNSSFKFLDMGSLAIAKLLYTNARTLVHHLDSGSEPTDIWKQTHKAWQAKKIRHRPVFFENRQSGLQLAENESSIKLKLHDAEAEFEKSVVQEIPDTLEALDIGNDPTYLLEPLLIQLIRSTADKKVEQEMSIILETVNNVKFNENAPEKYRHISNLFKLSAWHLCLNNAFSEAARFYEAGAVLVNQKSKDLLAELFANKTTLDYVYVQELIPKLSEEDGKKIKEIPAFQGMDPEIARFLDETKSLKFNQQDPNKFIALAGILLFKALTESRTEALQLYRKVMELTDKNDKMLHSLLHLHVGFALCSLMSHPIEEIATEMHLAHEGLEQLQFDPKEPKKYHVLINTFGKMLGASPDDYKLHAVLLNFYEKALKLVDPKDNRLIAELYFQKAIALAALEEPENLRKALDAKKAAHVAAMRVQHNPMHPPLPNDLFHQRGILFFSKRLQNLLDPQLRDYSKQRQLFQFASLQAKSTSSSGSKPVISAKASTDRAKTYVNS